MMKNEQPIFQRSRVSSNFSENEFSEALKLANYADIVKQLDHFYGQGELIYKIKRNSIK